MPNRRPKSPLLLDARPPGGAGPGSAGAAHHRARLEVAAAVSGAGNDQYPAHRFHEENIRPIHGRFYLVVRFPLTFPDPKRPPPKQTAIGVRGRRWAGKVSVNRTTRILYRLHLRHLLANTEGRGHRRPACEKRRSLAVRQSGQRLIQKLLLTTTDQLQQRSD